MLYAVLMRMARVALRWYYREVQIIGAERVPLDVRCSSWRTIRMR